MFSLLTTTPLGRRGRLHTAHGTIESPFFMPVGTAGAMKGLTHDDLATLGAQILLCNTYHLHLQPGEDVIEAAGGLHSFIGWDRPILTDSGGFQVFSLATLRKINDEEVVFQSHINGDELCLTPESAIQIQHKLGADIILCLDHCPSSSANRPEILEAMERTLRWARVCKQTHRRLAQERRNASTHERSPPLLFAVIQGGLERDLREKCAQELIAMGFDGYAIGGLAVGETVEEMYDVVQMVCPLLPADHPRYLLGVGEIGQLRACVAKGIDMFDCVLPMRTARHGELILHDGVTLRIKNSRYRRDFSPIDADSPSLFSRRHSRAYLHHLFKAGERLGETIACMQNLGVTLQTMHSLQEVIVKREAK
jgi:queuine tRNA-ribosyltransferase